jgi:hypothetical protein
MRGFILSIVCVTGAASMSVAALAQGSNLVGEGEKSGQRLEVRISSVTRAGRSRCDFD